MRKIIPLVGNPMIGIARRLGPIIFFMISSPLIAQQLTWSINIAPTVSYRSFPYQSNQGQLPLSAIGEKPMHTFDFGIDLRTTLSKRLSVGTAVLYSQKGFSNTYLSAAYQHEHIPATYLIDYQQHHLDIPFFVTYVLLNKNKLRIYPMAGVVNSMLLSENNRVTDKSGKGDPLVKEKLSTPYLRSASLHQVGLLAGLGVATDVNDKTQIGLEAQNKFMLTPVHDISSSTNRYLYIIGLNFRFIRKLR